MKVCPVCEGFTESRKRRCETCDAPLVGRDEVAWSAREGEVDPGNPWLGLEVGGKYRITGILGKGGMGTVYRAVHDTTHASVALKILHPRLSRHEAYKRALLLEARRASRVRGDHVARVLDAGETEDGGVFVAMELVDGSDLHSLVRRHGPLKRAELFEVLLQVVSGLEDAHRAGLVHRDLSSRNVMVERNRGAFRVRILDFGIARLDAEEEGSPGVWINPPYTAPEILLGEKADLRADLYSLGVLAVELATGGLPAMGSRIEDRIRQSLEGPSLIRTLPSGMPRGLLSLLKSLLATAREDRPRDAAEVRRRLQKLSRPHAPWFKVAAGLVFMAGFSSFLLALGGGREAYLNSLPSSAGGMLLFQVPPDPRLPPQRLRIEDLDHLEFEAFGFDAGELQVESYPEGRAEPSWKLPLPGEIHEGRLVLDRRTNPSWAAVLDRAAAERGVQTLVFRRVGRSGVGRPLAFARVFLDRVPPSVEGAALVPPGILRLDSRLKGTLLEDDERLAGLEIRLETMEGATLCSLDLPRRVKGAMDLPLGNMLAKRRPLEFRKPLRLVLTVRDPAGRQGATSLQIEACDLRIPRILEVSGPGGESRLRVSEGWCELRLKLDRPIDPEDGLTVLARTRSATRGADDLGCRVLEIRGDLMSVRMDPPSDPGRNAIPVEFRLRDAAGNLGPGLERSFRFLNLDLSPSFEMVPGPGGPATLERGERPGEAVLYLGPGSSEILYRCNPAFLPGLLPDPGGGGAPEGVEILAQGPGSCRFLVDGRRLEGDRILQFSHRLLSGKGTHLVPSGRLMEGRSRLAIHVLPDPPLLRVPEAAVSGRVWTPVLHRAGFLRRAGTEVMFGSGAALKIAARAGAQGRLWRFEGGGWIPMGERRGLTVEDFHGIRFALRPGRNRIALEVEDRLGRPLLGSSGSGTPLPSFRKGKDLFVLLCDFLHDPTPPRPVEVAVEPGHEVLVRLVEDADLGKGARVVLSPPGGGEELPGMFVPDPRGGGECRFRMSFPEVAVLCGWGGLSRRELLDQGPVERAFEVGTPAGKWTVFLRFRPIRSLLRTVRIGEFAEEGLPCGEITLVPFLPAGKEPWHLGPPSGVRVRGGVRFRRPVRVVGLEAFFLADRETTRGQWAAFLEDLEGHPLGEEDRKRLAIAEDPLGERRFDPEALIPDSSIFGSGGFRTLASLDPDRPVTGVDWFQAQAFCRWLGWRLFGDPGLFRLPFGVELEVAALAGGGDPERGGTPSSLNGLRPGKDAPGPLEAFLAARRRAQRGGGFYDGKTWPLSASELEALGDSASGIDRRRVTGLELGVREWVEDIPLVEGLGPFRILKGILETHERHRRFSVGRKRGEAELPDGFEAVARLGVLRGTTWGAPRVPGRDPLAGLLLPGLRSRSWNAVLGVRRITHLSRTGTDGLPADPEIRTSGFRIAGTHRFLSFVRLWLR